MLIARRLVNGAVEDSGDLAHFVGEGDEFLGQKRLLFGAAGTFEQRKILHIARADLDYVGVLLDEVERFVVNRLRDDAEAVLGSHFRKDLETILAEALEAVRGSARFVSAAAEEPRAGFV